MGMFHKVDERIVLCYLSLVCTTSNDVVQKQGDERPSFVGTIVRERERFGLNDTELAWAAAAM